MRLVVILCAYVLLYPYIYTQEEQSNQFLSDEHTVLLLHFDEGVGDIVNDASSYGNNGEANYVKWTKKGKFGDAIAFNGYMNVCIPDNDSLDLTNDFTVEAWICLDSKASIYNFRSIVIKSNTELKNRYKGVFIIKILYEVNYLKVTIHNDSDTYELISDEILEPNKYYHVGFSFKDGLLKLIINGKVVNSGEAPFEKLTNEEFNMDDIYIGNNWTNIAPFCGIIDEIRISNIARY